MRHVVVVEVSAHGRQLHQSEHLSSSQFGSLVCWERKWRLPNYTEYVCIATVIGNMCYVCACGCGSFLFFSVKWQLLPLNRLGQHAFMSTTISSCPAFFCGVFLVFHVFLQHAGTSIVAILSPCTKIKARAICFIKYVPKLTKEERTIDIYVDWKVDFKVVNFFLILFLQIVWEAPMRRIPPGKKKSLSIPRRYDWGWPNTESVNMCIHSDRTLSAV